MPRIIAGLLIALALAAPAAAQSLSPAEAAALRDRVDRLSAELADIRARLGTAGGTGRSIGGEVMVRLDRLEVELSRLTGEIEELRFRQRRIAEDGARRIGALDLRMTELEGGDITALAPQPPLGEEAAAPARPEPAPDPAPTPEPERTPGQDGATDGAEPGDGTDAQGVFGRIEPAPETGADDPMLALARDDIRQGRFDQGERRLREILDDALDARAAAEAHFWLGQSRFTRGAYAEAARSYLNSYNSAQSGPRAAEALLQLGITLGRLGQRREACLTLREVRSRFPDGDSQVLDAADQEADALACGP